MRRCAYKHFSDRIELNLTRVSSSRDTPLVMLPWFHFTTSRSSSAPQHPTAPRFATTALPVMLRSCSSVRRASTRFSGYFSIRGNASFYRLKKTRKNNDARWPRRNRARESSPPAIGAVPLSSQVKSYFPVHMKHLEPATGRGKASATQRGTMACEERCVWSGSSSSD